MLVELGTLVSQNTGGRRHMELIYLKYLRTHPAYTLNVVLDGTLSDSPMCSSKLLMLRVSLGCSDMLEFDRKLLLIYIDLNNADRGTFLLDSTLLGGSSMSELKNLPLIQSSSNRHPFIILYRGRPSAGTFYIDNNQYFGQSSRVQLYYLRDAVHKTYYKLKAVCALCDLSLLIIVSELYTPL